MSILTIYATPHKGNTHAVTQLFLGNFKDGNNTFDEITLPTDMNNICMGCGNCVVKKVDEDYWKNQGYLDGKKPY